MIDIARFLLTFISIHVICCNKDLSFIVVDDLQGQGEEWINDKPRSGANILERSTLFRRLCQLLQLASAASIQLDYLSRKSSSAPIQAFPALSLHATTWRKRSYIEADDANCDW